MGDRGNIKVITGLGEPVIFYGHWSGYNLPDIARRALIQARGSGAYPVSRWDDGPYLARCVFQQMVGDDKDNSGFGISTTILDNDYPVVVLDSTDLTVRLENASYDADTGWSTRPRDQHWSMTELADAEDPDALLGWNDSEDGQ